MIWSVVHRSTCSRNARIWLTKKKKREPRQVSCCQRKQLETDGKRRLNCFSFVHMQVSITTTLTPFFVRQYLLITLSVDENQSDLHFRKKGKKNLRDDWRVLAYLLAAQVLFRSDSIIRETLREQTREERKRNQRWPSSHRTSHG